MARPYSISRRLIWTLSVAQVIALTLGTLGILISIILLLPRTPDPADRIAPVIAHSVVAGPGGDLRLQPAQDLRRLVEQNPGFWVTGALADGRTFRYGAIPPQLEARLAALSGVGPGYFQPAGDKANSQSVMTRTADAPGLGRATLTFGGFNPRSYWLLGLFIYFRVIFIPLLIATVLTPTLVVPLVVRRVMARMRATTSAAETVSFDTLGQRLPTDAVPGEILPLVTAVNDALERLDVGQAQRTRFLTDAAHELRTPIAILLTRLEGLPPGEEQQKLLADVARLADTAEQLLDVQRLEHAGAPRGRVDLVDLGRQVVGDLAPLAIANGYQLSFASEVEVLSTEGDEPALERAMTNLVRNAIEHGGGGGDIRVMVRANRSVEVADQGPGVPEPYREEIFQPFRRLQPRDKGAGLGLTLVRQVMQRHGGQVSVIPQPQGALFRLSFPAPG